MVGEVGEEHAPMSIVLIAKTIEVRLRIATDVRKSPRLCLCGSIHPARGGFGGGTWGSKVSLAMFLDRRAVKRNIW